MAIAPDSNGNFITMSSNGDSITRRLIPRKVVWESIGTAGDDLKLVDPTDSSIVFAETKGQQYEDKEIVGLCGADLINGLQVITIDSGKLFLYL